MKRPASTVIGLCVCLITTPGICEPSPPAETCGPDDSLGAADSLPWIGSLGPSSQDFALIDPSCSPQVGDDVVVCLTPTHNCMIDAVCYVDSGAYTFNTFVGESAIDETSCLTNFPVMDFEISAGHTYCIVCSGSDSGPITVFIQVAPGGGNCGPFIDLIFDDGSESGDASA